MIDLAADFYEAVRQYLISRIGEDALKNKGGTTP